jgi:hypothetical protein
MTLIWSPPNIVTICTPSVVCFSAMFALDFVWIFYTKAVQRHLPLPAALWALAILAFNGITQIGYVHDPWLLIPTACGAFAGTYSAMKWSQHHEP